jgi:predicted nucleotidyltransferase component of viral defense system
MKEYVRDLVDKKEDDLQKRSLVREYLQARILQALQDAGAFKNWAFLGGTALRFLYAIPRYSEDLDFSLKDKELNCDFINTLKKVKRSFEAETYELNIKVSDKKNVMSALLKFPGLLREVGCSAHPTESLTIKCEIDTNPPDGATIETTIIRRFVTVNISHYDKPSLLAGKLHALLQRQYTKGRDLYDLVWYLSSPSWPEPNITLLNAALEHSEWNGERVTAANWQRILGENLERFDWQRARADLAPFIERQEDLKLITQENCLKLLNMR